MASSANRPVTVYIDSLDGNDTKLPRGGTYPKNLDVDTAIAMDYCR